MSSTLRVRGWLGCVLFLCGFAVALAVSEPAAAQTATSVSLILQDFSDCTNANVPTPAGAPARGTVFIVRNTDGTTTLKVGMTVQPDTTYHFFLKCVRLLGDIKTGDEGIGEAIYTLPAGTVGAVFAFDMYPEGAPAGNKYQSMQVHLQ
jgi:hypothetical protein